MGGEGILGAGPCEDMYFLDTGCLSKYGKILPHDTVIGEEALLDTGENRHPVRALTDCLLYLVRKDDMNDLRAEFPAANCQIRRWVARFAFRRDARSVIRLLRPHAFDN